MDDLFGDPQVKPRLDPASSRHMPIAARLRPEKLSEVAGQSHIIGEGKLLNRIIQTDRLSSLIFYGPPGCGKTTLARIISQETKARFISLNAVSSNVAELRKAVTDAEQYLKTKNIRSVLFIDEIHRFSKSQQDVLMPYVENGIVILIGATTHNPSFSINSPLLSRSTVFELRPLEPADLQTVLRRALKDPVKGLGSIAVDIDDTALEFIITQSGGDARKALNALEIAVMSSPVDEKGIRKIDIKQAAESCQKNVVHYDHDEDYHYDTISAFIKSMRGSDPDAAIYWLAKMLHAGEDPRFIVRRMIILASEDIGNADPQALVLAVSALQALEFVGMPEAQIILSQVVAYLSLAPKSNASYLAISSATADIKAGKIFQVPDHLRDSHYPGASAMGHGAQYQYPHAMKNPALAELPTPQNQRYLPANIRYYFPKISGFEKTLLERLSDLNK